MIVSIHSGPLLCRSRLLVQQCRTAPRVWTQHFNLSARLFNDKDSAQDDGLPTQRVRLGNNAPLPLPPLLNTVVKAARRRWTRPKPLPTPADITPFRERINNNPYAHALAMPVRQCSVTQQNLPSFFMRNLTIKRDPSTDTEWFLPITDFGKINREARPAKCAISHLNSQKLANFLFGEGGTKPHLSEKKKRLSKTLGKNTTPQSRNSIMRVAQAMVVNMRPKWMPRMFKGQVKWRPDLADLYLDLSRAHARRTLALTLKNKKKGPDAWAVAVEDPQTLAEHDNVACMLYVGGPGPSDFAEQVNEANKMIAFIEKGVMIVAEMFDRARRRDEDKTDTFPPEQIGLSRLQEKVKYPPVQYPTMPYRDRKVALYHLWDLFGEDMAKEILAETRFRNAKWIALTESKWTRNVQMQLMRLQGYIQTPI
ncbi:hypothetical protein EJ05DRAFT_476382 [Pseudovirgaria hyperparasitica]|uniref:Uncharacterized protein n=1 Tax=Pseudovirgaria hyperparasitica TaxID=470096 RepID=A0A6A6WAH5_9PEZI|nr:uncharacterized protein EJ05DRAFT_476382 [Pseudovirgaria hyperparasitica]KAF2758121.1 hypothetical protein EJ05DRAFT_476382 [Pseudovirgaria hyperparasitica]